MSLIEDGVFNEIKKQEWSSTNCTLLVKIPHRFFINTFFCNGGDKLQYVFLEYLLVLYTFTVVKYLKT